MTSKLQFLRTTAGLRTELSNEQTVNSRPSYAQVSLDYAGIALYVPRLPLHCNGPVLKNIGSVRVLQRHMSILLHKQHGYALGFIDTADEGKNLPGNDRRKPHGGLIEEKNPGVAHEGPSDGQHLLLSAR